MPISSVKYSLLFLFCFTVTSHASTKIVDAYAHWLNQNTLVIAHYSAKNNYRLQSINPKNIDKNTPSEHNINKTPLIDTKLTLEKLNPRLANKFPHLAHYQAFQLNLTKPQAKQWLKTQLQLVSLDSEQKVITKTAVQTGNVLDDLYTSGDHDANEEQNLGAYVNEQGITFKLWAPTAITVKVLLFNQDKSPALPSSLRLHENKNTGIWQTQLLLEKNSPLRSAYYKYQLTLYHPRSQQIETLTVTDPYSLSLSTNSEYSQAVDLNDSSTMPIGWQQQSIPTLAKPEDQLLYEVHIRDFSANDPQLSNKTYRGKYLAFSEQQSAGIKHIKNLRKAGVNTIHLLPSFDIGTINENKAQVIDLNDPLSKICQLSTKVSVCQTANLNITAKSLLKTYKKTDTSQQKAQQFISEIRTLDNYNWGYDPFHYTVPEGSYALNPEGKARIIEFRQMIQSLHNLGFRVVMDVVYNHTHQAGLAKTSVLDKIVPNYYQRLHPISGKIAQSTCCDNTATERAMMAKLMIDSLIVWARDYKIDGFRFDLMGHQPKKLMLAARNAVKQIDDDNYFYGEGWNFGEVANNQRFVQATQLELAGSEIGTYSDRLRDAVRGRGIATQGDDIRRAQGIGNGLVTLPNELANEKNNAEYGLLMDQLRIGLAGNLQNFPLVNHQGKAVVGKEIPYGDQIAGYALDPADIINYVSKHDNQTLWDNNQYRLPFYLSIDDRVRLHNQSLSYVLFAQGIPFIHMGSELLRSKSFLRDSYDYSDWFNGVDFTKQNNFYNQGLPPADKDKANWPLITKLRMKNQGRDIARSQHIQLTDKVFQEFVKIRFSSPLFRLATSDEILKQVHFLNTGKAQQPGLIVMLLGNTKITNSTATPHKLIDQQPKQIPARQILARQIMVIFNSSAKTQSFSYAQAKHFTLHPVQQQSADKVVQQAKSMQHKFIVPALTTAVFVRE